MALSETSIVNMALARLGANRINALTDTSVEAIQANLHYTQTRDALLRSHTWCFARARAILSVDTTAPAFGYDHQYILPADFLRLVGLYDTSYPYAIEGDRLLTDDDATDLYYIRKVTDPAEFDPLFAEVLVLQLAVKLVMPLSGDKVLRREVQDELFLVMARVRTVDKQEQNIGTDTGTSWVDSRTQSTT